MGKIQERFDAKLEELVGKMTAAELMALPGFYEIVSEELNNEILDALRSENEEVRQAVIDGCHWSDEECGGKLLLCEGRCGTVACTNHRNPSDRKPGVLYCSACDYPEGDDS